MTHSVVVAVCQALAFGSWCGLAYYASQMARNVRPGPSIWTGALAWNPLAALRADRFTEVGRVCRVRAAQAFGTWVAAIVGGVIAMLLSGTR